MARAKEFEPSGDQVSDDMATRPVQLVFPDPIVELKIKACLGQHMPSSSLRDIWGQQLPPNGWSINLRKIVLQEIN